MLDQLVQLLLGDAAPVLPKTRKGRFERLYPEGLTMGTLYLGRQGTGKTSSLAQHLVDYFQTYPNRAIFVLDWSGSISDNLLGLILQAPPATQAALGKRLVYDELGHPEWVVPLPEFSRDYGVGYEEQVQRLSNNLVKLAPHLVTNAPILGGVGLREIAPMLFRLLTVMTNADGEPWQVTEAVKLLLDPARLRLAIERYGYQVPAVQWWLEHAYLPLSPTERELRTYALRSLLNAVSMREARAKIGYSQPGWTPREAIQKGQLVLINGARLINQKQAQHYLFTQVYSLIMQEINQRQPGNPADAPIALVMDEVYSLLSIPGMAEEIGMLSPLYRSRKLELYIVLQSLAQLAPTLRAQIWSLGNVVSFALANVEEAYEVAQQLFPYDPQTVKRPANLDTQHPLLETDRGQYLTIANWVQRLRHRECLLRRFVSEKKLEPTILHVPRTREQPGRLPTERLAETKAQLLQTRGVPIRAALEAMDQRELVFAQTRKIPPQL